MDNLSIDVLSKKIINEFAKTVEMFGFGALEARLFAYLYLTEKTMTLDDMSEALGKSKTSMSTSIRGLADANLVKRVWKKGVRKDLYRANTQLFKLFTTSYLNKWIDAATYRQTELIEVNQWVHSQHQADLVDDKIKQLTTQLDKMIKFHEQIKSFFNQMKQS